MKQKLIERFRSAAKAAYDQWIKQNVEEEAIHELVTNKLNGDIAASALKAIGMKPSWNGWEIDQCNGNRGYIERQLIEQAKVAVDDFVKSFATDAAKLSPKDAKAVRAAYQAAFASECRRLAADRAEADALAMIDEIMQGVNADASATSST